MYVRQVPAQQVRPGHVLHAGTGRVVRVAGVAVVHRRPAWWRHRRPYVVAYGPGGQVVGQWRPQQLVTVAWWPAQK